MTTEAVMWLRGIVKCLLAVALLGSPGFAFNGRVEELRLTREHPLVEHIPGQRVTPLEHTTMEEIVKELNNMGPESLTRHKRQTEPSGEPVTVGRHEFGGDDSQYGRILYTGDQSNVIFVMLYDVIGGLPVQTSLYRSVDYGSTFTNIESQLDASDSDPLLWPIFYISPSNKNKLVFPHATQSKIYYTLDEGDTWATQEFTPSTINPRSLLWNPTEDNWIIAHDSTNDRLYVTQNLGQTWIKIADYVDAVTDYQWGVPGTDSDSSIIYFNVYDPTDVLSGDFTVDLYTQRQPYTDDTRQEFDPNLGRHTGFLIVGLYIFATKEIDSELTLFVSYNRDPFNMALIPSTLTHEHYYVAHINSLQALVIVEHTVGQFNLYLSDLSGVYFSLSLPDIVLVNGYSELQLIQGVNGTMIANQYVREDPSESNPPLRTLITLDNGGIWELLRAPTDAANPCEPPLCSLHFHMDSSEYWRLGVYSDESAPGIIVAHGTAGTELSADPDLYISRDGGISWEKTLDSSWGVRVLDHGGLMVAAKDYHQGQFNEIMYTCNEGISWQPFVYGGSSIYVWGVITEPGEHTTVVSLYGTDQTFFSYHWEVVTINFTDIFPRMCNDQDYYDWMPWDGRLDGELCVLGSSITIERRKVDVCCLNGRDYVREFGFQICQCAAEDFECDYGYQRADGITGPCVRDPSVTLPNLCASGSVTTYNRSRGYRKVAGDVCEGGDESLFLPYLATCCQGTNTSSDVDCGSLSSPSNGQVSLITTNFGSVATYSCNNGYRISGQSMTICQSDGTWSGSTPTCEIVDCGQLDDITNGQVTLSTTTYGSSAMYSCVTGYTLNGPNSRTCQANGTWSGSEPSCDPVDCGLVTAPANGVVTLSSTMYLSVATYGCSTGYQLSGQNTQTCQANGTWSGNNPTCDIVDCGTPTTPTNGQANFVSFNFTSVVTYSCDSGYTLSGPNSRFCQSDGTWSGSEPTCTIVDCGQLEDITSGLVTLSTTTYGSSASYSCATGYTLNGPNSRTCQENGTWSGSVPTCDPVDCGLVVAPTNGVVTLSSTMYLSVATYRCSTGYELSGQNTQTCQANGTWSGNNPTCDIVDCGTPTAPTNGQANFVSINFTSVVTYSCDSGYTLSGPNSRFCQSDGTWSGSEPTCTIVDCGQLEDITSGLVTLSTTTYGSSASYSCVTGYTLNGPNSRTCQEDGTWSGSEPSCDPVDCGLVTAPANGVVTLPSTMYPAVATYGCSTGYELSGQNTQTCQANGTWSGNNPTCDIVDCGTPTAPTNGQANFVSINFTSVVTYSCDSGYTFSGPNSRFCQSDGTWSGSTPTCEIVDCGQLDDITNGQVTLSTTTYGSSATYSCATGYTLSGPNSRICQQDETWSGSEPSCDLVDCGLVTAPANGVVTLPSTMYPAVATYGCSTGYELSGQNTRTCQANGTWSGNNPTCDIVDCGTPTAPTNGQANFVSINFTSVVAYSCDNGYVLSGPNSRFCQSDGTWSGSEPTSASEPTTCEVMDCSPLTDPANGQIDTPSITFGSVATYSCNKGYRISGQSMIICQADGTWSGSTPTCEIVDCGQLDHITNGQMTVSTTTYGSSGTYSCKIGYTLNGPATTTCEADGYWSGSVPTCDTGTISTIGEQRSTNTTTDKEEDESSTIAVGVVLLLVIIAVVVLLLVIVVFFRKYYTLRKKWYAVRPVRDQQEENQYSYWKLENNADAASLKHQEAMNSGSDGGIHMDPATAKVQYTAHK